MAIVDSIMNLLTRQVITSLADRLGTMPSAIQAAIGTSVAALLGGIANRAGDPGFVSQVFNLVKTADTQNILNTLPSLAAGTAMSSPATKDGLKFSSLLLGSQKSHIESFIARQSGLTADAGHELMSLAAPLTAAFLGHEIRSAELTTSSFASMIRSETSEIQDFLPLGLPLLLAAVPIPAKSGKVETIPKDGGRKILFALIGLLLLGLIAWLVLRDHNRSGTVTGRSAELVIQAPAETSAAEIRGEFTRHTLFEGTQLNITRPGIENRLLNLTETQTRAVEMMTWFDFERLTFDAGKATLRDSSAEQLQNIAAILKAYPNMKVKIGGYTDNAGDRQANVKLSQERANNVMRELVKRGIDPSRLEAQGYGEEHPVADNSTPEGRQQNRRIALRLTAT
jgi:OmpA-OmpF porin, OOP family